MEVNPYESPKETGSAPSTEPARHVSSVGRENQILVVTALLVAIVVPSVVLMLFWLTIFGRRG